jgi:inner membrane protein
MRFPLLGKLCALGAVALALVAALGSVQGLVSERQMRQREAEQSVVDSLAGAQTVLGPVLQRRCTEAWQRTEVQGKERKTVDERRDFVVTDWPRRLDVRAAAAIEPRYRGLFKINAYLSKTTLTADWAPTRVPPPSGEHAGAQVRCQPATVSVVLSDARGIRSAAVRLDGRTVAVAPGSQLATRPRGFHVVVPDDAAAPAGLHADITLDMAGTGSLGWTPVGDETRVQLTSDWAHPSFGGNFLPVEREIGAQGFRAQWQVSALATTAQQQARGDAASVESFGVSFIDPVNTYVLSDRATKYGLLFILLTFVGVALVEVLRRLRVHPIQYLLVGLALTVFFLLLLGLGEHLAFEWAYLGASGACTALLTFYGSHVLRGLKPGLVFGLGIATLYGALYALLQMEQNALVLGSLLIFAVLAAVMFATRRIDWYALGLQLRRESAPREPEVQQA